MNREVFSQRVTQLRTSRNLTQKQLGEVFGLAKQTVNGWEAGTSTPNLEITVALADFFEVSIDYLVGESNDPARR